jgi:hypothetical protein
MKRIHALLITCTLVSLASPLAGQQLATISAGMTAAEVRATFGPPAVVREGDGWTYFFYTNRCLPRCGTDDTVFLQDGRVVAAVLHAPARRFEGPAAADALPSPAQAPSGTAPPAQARISGIRVRTSDGEADLVTNLGVIQGRAPAPAAGPEPTPDSGAGTPVEPPQR